jgi:hypothetical protein
MADEEDEIAKAMRLSMEANGGGMDVDSGKLPPVPAAAAADGQAMETSEQEAAQPEEQLGELPPVDDILFNTLKEMGYPENRVTKALILTGNVSVGTWFARRPTCTLPSSADSLPHLPFFVVPPRQSHGLDH